MYLGGQYRVTRKLIVDRASSAPSMQSVIILRNCSPVYEFVGLPMGHEHSRSVNSETFHLQDGLKIPSQKNADDGTDDDDDISRIDSHFVIRK